MHTLGLLGGMTYHATISYYSQINEYVQKQLGDGASAKILLHSFDFAELMDFYNNGHWEEVGRQLGIGAKNLASIGAEAIVLCCNTNHKWTDEIEKAASIPFLHIIDFTGEAILQDGLKKVALLGTKVTMEGDFIKGRLEEKYGLQVLLPPEEIRNQMDGLIFEELSQMIVTTQTKKLFTDAVEQLVKQGAQGVILGCTELQFVLKPDEVDVPLYDTVTLHARGAAEWALRE